MHISPREKPDTTLSIPQEEKDRWIKEFEATGLSREQAVRAVERLATKTQGGQSSIRGVRIPKRDFAAWREALSKVDDFTDEEVDELLHILAMDVDAKKERTGERKVIQITGDDDGPEEVPIRRS